MIQFEKEVLGFLNIPSIPLKEWDGKSSFNNGVAIVTLYTDVEAYAVTTFDAETDSEPRVKKTFSIEPFKEIKSIFVVPSYMDTNVEDADVDNDTKEAMQRLAEEAEEMENEGVGDDKPEMPENEWCFDEIHNKEEALAWLKNYNTRNKIKGKLPKNEEVIKLRLLTIWKNQQNNK
jgi:hypothetical protein